MKKITIGSAVYDDPQGIWYTYQSIKLNNQDILDDLDFVVIDNNPSSPEGRATKEICKKIGVRYLTYTKKNSTACRNEIFRVAKGLFTICLDSHVLLESDTIKNFIRYTEENPEIEDLLQGPMLHDSLTGGSSMETHMKPEWRGDMFGTWAKDARGFISSNTPFEIPMHGLGAFACKTDTWLGFHPLFEGFGGEEGYIHAKYKRHGRKTLCLPFFRWLHRFRINEKVSYPLKIEDRIRNYTLGHLDNELNVEEIRNYFLRNRPNMEVDEIINETIELHNLYIENPDLISDILLEPIEETEEIFNGKSSWAGGTYQITLDSYLRIQLSGKFPLYIHGVYFIEKEEKQFLKLHNRKFDSGIELTEQINYVDFDVREHKNKEVFITISPASYNSIVSKLSFLSSCRGDVWDSVYDINT
jgi:hypothetical protein